MRILYLVTKTEYDRKLDSVYFHGINALSKQKQTSVTIWGPGWQNYNNQWTVQQNLDTKNKFDVVITSKPLNFKGFKDIKPLKCLRYNDMWNVKETLKEIRKSRAQLVVCHFITEFKKYTQMKIPDVKFVYVGHGAEPTIFKKHDLKKEFDITLIGGAYPSPKHPLRNKLLKLIPILSKEYKCLVYHPSLKTADISSSYLKDYARIIAQSRIVLYCSSKYKYRTSKYVEIPMCHTILCADKPDTADNYDFLIEINDKI